MVFASIAKAIFGSANDRQVKKYQPRVDAINALEPAMAKLSDAELKAKTEEFKAELAQGAKLADGVLRVAFGRATVEPRSSR